jgi:hypothetical protein
VQRCAPDDTAQSRQNIELCGDSSQPDATARVRGADGCPPRRMDCRSPNGLAALGALRPGPRHSKDHPERGPIRYAIVDGLNAGADPELVRA